MSELRRSFSQHWPVWLAFAFIAVLPLRREMEWPLSIFAISLAFLASNAEKRKEIRQAARFLVPLFLFIWVPMLISSLDSLDPSKSWMQTIPSLRFLSAALAIAVLLRNEESRDLFLRLACWLLLFWAADGYFQLVFGYDVFGVPMHEDRLNAMFYSRYAAYGPTLALLSPLALEHMRRHWNKTTWLIGFAMILGAVLMSGVRSAWIMMLVVIAIFTLKILRQSSGRRLAVTLVGVSLLTLGAAILASPLFQERLKLSAQVVLATEQAIDEASSYRLPIFSNALAMYRDHPINGVGVRAFRKAYLNYAEPDDPHFIDGDKKTRAHQAHNFVLEFMADTGTIGLLGFVAALVFSFRYWRKNLSGHAREQAFPYAAALLVIVFPLNSYFAFFGVYMMSISWVLAGLMAAAMLGNRSTNPG